MTMKIYGYVRISSSDQNTDRQMIIMREHKIPEENIYVDRQSGKDFNRPQYKEMCSKLKKGDLLYIPSLDRLGRNYQEMQEEWRVLTKVIQIDICVIDMPLLDTRTNRDLLGTLISDITLQLFCYVAEIERRNLHERQAQGIAAAKARGVIFGIPRKDLPDNFPDLVEKWRNKKIPLDQILEECKISKSTFFRRVKEMGL